MKRSAYGDRSIVDEDLTSAIPAQLHTGPTYFRNAESKINALTEAIGLPQLFLTLTFSERWVEYQEILKNTGGGNTTPSNRPWEAFQYYHYRWQSLKEILLRKPKVSEYVELKELIERLEFQNRGAIHTHGLLWTAKSIEEMIAEDYVRADLPDPETEPELHELVRQQQTHNCRNDLRRKSLDKDLEVCHKGLPAPLSDVTHRVGDNLRYNYKRTKEADRWRSPYNAVILWIWRAHMNIQYCTSAGLVSYVSKYVAKPEPKNLYNTQENHNPLNDHILAWRMGSMEVMMHLLSYHIFREVLSI